MTNKWREPVSMRWFRWTEYWSQNGQGTATLVVFVWPEVGGAMVNQDIVNFIKWVCFVNVNQAFADVNKNKSNWSALFGRMELTQVIAAVDR